MEKPAARVNSVRIGNHVGQVVRLVGKVIALEGQFATVEASDGGRVKVKLNRDANFADEYVEIVGKVAEDHSMTEYTSKNIGKNIDMALVQQVTELTHRYPELFPPID